MAHGIPRALPSKPFAGYELEGKTRKGKPGQFSRMPTGMLIREPGLPLQGWLLISPRALLQNFPRTGVSSLDPTCGCKHAHTHIHLHMHTIYVRARADTDTYIHAHIHLPHIHAYAHSRAHTVSTGWTFPFFFWRTFTLNSPFLFCPLEMTHTHALAALKHMQSAASQQL